MPGLAELKVSLTKNGYFKVVEVIVRHPRHEVLANLRGTHMGINLDRAQIANMLSADPETGELPEEWDEVRQYPQRAIGEADSCSEVGNHGLEGAGAKRPLHSNILRAVLSLCFASNTRHLRASIPGLA